MSWHYSRALEAEFSQAAYSAGEQSAPLSSTGTDGPCSPPARMTAALSPSPSGTTCGPLTGSRGEAALTSYREAFPVRRIPRRLEAATSRMISGRKCGESWQRSLPGTYLPRTSSDAQSTARPTNWNRWVTAPAPLPFRRQTWVQITFGNGTGYLHTPTATANYASPSMQKWPNCREFVRVFGSPSPGNHEWLMGWPFGWSGLRPLETDRFQLWLQWHSGF